MFCDISLLCTVFIMCIRCMVVPIFWCGGCIFLPGWPQDNECIVEWPLQTDHWVLSWHVLSGFGQFFPCHVARQLCAVDWNKLCAFSFWKIWNYETEVIDICWNWEDWDIYVSMVYYQFDVNIEVCFLHVFMSLWNGV